MKFMFLIIGFLILASCSHEVKNETNTGAVATQETITEQQIEELEENLENNETVSQESNQEVIDEINASLNELESVSEVSPKPVLLEAHYNNPKGLVDMVVNYTLDANGVITAIGVSATTYDGTANFNDEIQSLVGKTLEDAVNHKTGSSLTGDAFKKAIKSQL
ncbi:hypothetical protein MK079_00985 [Candidatus Gracilibacteria bacterium]|nr:hypothetical protein [Candidatus Gracilibacteria bacterium]